MGNADEWIELLRPTVGFVRRSMLNCPFLGRLNSPPAKL
jgi:hypothetical protein